MLGRWHEPRKGHLTEPALPAANTNGRTRPASGGVNSQHNPLRRRGGPSGVVSLRASVWTNNVFLRVTPTGLPTSSLVPATPTRGQTVVTKTDRVQKAAVPQGTDQGTGRGDGSSSFSHGGFEPQPPRGCRRGPSHPTGTSHCQAAGHACDQLPEPLPDCKSQLQTRAGS